MKLLSDKVTGSVLLAAGFSELAKENENVMTALGQTLTSGDLNLLGKGIAGYAANSTFYTDSGVANVYILNIVGLKQRAPALADGFKLEFITTNPNTGASTVNPSSLGVRNIKTQDGTDPLAGDISGFVTLIFNVSSGNFTLINPSVTGAAIEFETVQQMKDSTILVPGMFARTFGYITKGDSGSNSYAIVSATTGTVDGGAFIQLTGTLHRAQGLFEHGIVYVEQYGVKSDDLTAAAANTIALNNANLNTLFKRVDYLGKKYSVDGSIMFRSGYKYRGVRDGTEIECLLDKNIMVSEAFVASQGVSPTGELSIHNIRSRGLLTNLNQIGVAIFDFAIDLQFVEPITCGGGGLHLVDRDDAGTPATGTLVANRIRSCRISNCLGIGLKIGDTDNLNKLTDYTVSDCTISMNAGVAGDLNARHFFTGSAAGSTIENIFFEGQVTRLVAEILNAQSARIKDLRFDAVEDRGLVLANIQGGVIATGLDFTGNLTSLGPSNRLIDLSQSAAPNTTPSVIIEANVTLSTDVSDIIVVHNQSLDADIQAKILVNGAFRDNLILRGGSDDNRRDQIQLLADATVLGKLTDRNNDSTQLGIVHNGIRLGYTAVEPGLFGAGPHTCTFPFKLTSFQELIPQLRIGFNRNDNGPLIATFKQDLFVSSKDNLTDNWFLQVLAVPSFETGFVATPVITVEFTPGSGDEGLIKVVFTLNDPNAAEGTGIANLSF